MLPIQHIHPIVVHFPIVFFLTLAFVDIVALAMGYSVTGRSATGNLATGLAVAAGTFAILAAMFGDAALEFAEANGFSSEIAEIHEGLGETTAAVLAVWALIRLFVWWRDKRLAGGIGWGFAALEVAGCALVVATAYYGGQLVYTLGVNVAHAAQ